MDFSYLSDPFSLEETVASENEKITLAQYQFQNVRDNQMVSSFFWYFFVDYAYDQSQFSQMITMFFLVGDFS